MKVSVITVCYNSAATLESALLSVASQDWPEVEHIVVDGGSSDGSLQIIERQRGALAQVISEPDHGIYDAMNKGLDLATGDVVCFLNADDQYASASVLSRVVSQMVEHHLDLLMGDVGFFREGQPDRMVRRYRSDRFTPERLAWGWMPAHPGLFMKRQVFDRVGRFRTDYRIAGDYEYLVRVFKEGAPCYRHYPEVLVRMQTGGASTNGWRAKVRLNQEVLRALRENGIRTNMLKILSKYPLKFLEIFNK